jgi:hypothetical protein
MGGIFSSRQPPPPRAPDPAQAQIPALDPVLPTPTAPGPGLSGGKRRKSKKRKPKRKKTNRRR